MKVTLPSWINLGASEIILATDKPVPKSVKDSYVFIKEKYAYQEMKLFEVEKNPEYIFHQANVRRSAFRNCKNDIILTGDIDLKVNKEPCLKALNLVGKNGIGLCSIAKRYLANSISKLWRNTMYNLILPIYPSRFTGLYAFYRPFWIETEDHEGIKQLENPIHRRTVKVCTGEDTFLKNCMALQYRCLFLRDIGARSLRVETEDQRNVQYENGRYQAHLGKSIFKVLASTFLYLRPFILSGYIHQRWGDNGK